MRKPYFSPKYIPETGEWFYRGKYLDHDPRGQYDADLEDWAAAHEDDQRHDS